MQNTKIHFTPYFLLPEVIGTVFATSIILSHKIFKPSCTF